MAMDKMTEVGVALLREMIADLTVERDKLAAFKTYVHKRLDDAGVPVDPESPHKAEGCRVGGRLDSVFAELSGLRAENVRMGEILEHIASAGES